jgi:hypothetical protein
MSKFYQVAITGIVRVADEDPSPATWEWSLDNLADRVQQNLEHVDVEFREMTLAPKTGDFATHFSHCKWPDDTCLCQK